MAARNANDIAAAVICVREHNLRLVVKGGGHSYQGTSNAPDSLLIWTTIAGKGGAYVSESNFFESDFQHASWGNNYTRLVEIKRKYDLEDLFLVHNGVGSEP